MTILQIKRNDSFNNFKCELLLIIVSHTVVGAIFFIHTFHLKHIYYHLCIPPQYFINDCHNKQTKCKHKIYINTFIYLSFQREYKIPVQMRLIDVVRLRFYCACNDHDLIKRDQ